VKLEIFGGLLRANLSCGAKSSNVTMNIESECVA